MTMSTESIIAIISIILSTGIGIYQIMLSKRVKKSEIDIKNIHNSISKINIKANKGGIVGNSNNGDISNNVL